VQADGAAVSTVEGLAEGETLSALQTAFSRHGALQCGFCTAGILISATRYLEEEPAPTEESVRSMLTGHICRCTGYQGMVEAILDVAGSAGGSDGDR
jgi:2-furoyl-CoA dehydrogenase 2Fe-2S iron sulfur subunit